MEFIAKYGEELFMLGLVFLVRHFFAGITSKIDSIQDAFNKLDGRLETLQKDVRENTTQNAVTKQEMRAIWRYVDNAPMRASDMNGGE